MSSHLQFIKTIKRKKNYKKIKDRKYKIGTDCSGIESPIMALKLLNIKFSHEFSCDNDKFVKEQIMASFKPKIFYDNIFKRDHKKLPDIDIYVCGFPCQSFSTAGNREGFHKKSKEGIIFFECLKVIKHTKPIFFILENVKGLLTHEKGKTFKKIKSLLNKLKDYDIYFKVLRTSDFNIPQKRDRLYIVGIKKKLSKKTFCFPNPVKSTLTLEDILSNKKKSTKKFLLPSKLEIVKKKKEHYNIKPSENWAINLNASYPYATTTQDLSPCLVTTCNMIYLTKYNRFLTVRECLRLQGFPDKYTLISPPNISYKQIGNSMSVNILCFLLYEILESLLL